MKQSLQKLNGWLGTTPIGSAIKVFIALFCGAMVLSWSDSGNIDFGNWQTWFIGALTVAVLPLWNWLNPHDPRYGRGAVTSGS